MTTEQQGRGMSGCPGPAHFFARPLRPPARPPAAPRPGPRPTAAPSCTSASSVNPDGGGRGTGAPAASSASPSRPPASARPWRRSRRRRRCPAGPAPAASTTGRGCSPAAGAGLGSTPVPSADAALPARRATSRPSPWRPPLGGRLPRLARPRGVQGDGPAPGVVRRRARPWTRRPWPRTLVSGAAGTRGGRGAGP